MASLSRFVLDLRVGPRTLELAKQLVAAVAGCCIPGLPLPLLLMDDHLPYPTAILEVFGLLKHRRRRRPQGRKRQPGLKPPPGLLAGVVQKVRDATGHLSRVRGRALFGSKREILKRIAALGIGQTIATAHVERLNGTLRGQQARLARKSQHRSQGEGWLQWSLWLWRDLYNWTRRHGSMAGKSPAVVLGLTDHVWSVQEYVRYPVHVSDLQHDLWDEQRQELLTSALERHKQRKTLPTS